MANQFLVQLKGPILEVIMVNVGTTAMFGLGLRDASALARFVRSQITSDDLINLDRFNAVVRLLQSG